MRNWTFWDWLGYGAIAIGAIILALDSGLKGAPRMAAVMPNFMVSDWMPFTPLVFVLLGTAVLGARALGWRGFGWPGPLPTINTKQAGANALSWLEKIASEDDQQFPNRIYPLPLSTTNKSYLSAPNPFTMVTLYFINSSVFTVTPVRVEGRYDYRGFPLQDVPQLDSPSPIKHGEERPIVICQWLTTDVAKEIVANGGASLASGNVGIVFSYTNLAGELKEGRSSIGNPPLMIA